MEETMGKRIETRRKIPNPGAFWTAAILSTVFFGAITFPALGSHPEFIVIPIVCGGVISAVLGLAGDEMEERDFDEAARRMINILSQRRKEDSHPWEVERSRESTEKEHDLPHEV